MDLKYFSKKNKLDFNFVLPKIGRYITTQNTLPKRRKIWERSEKICKIQDKESKRIVQRVYC